MAPTSTVNLFLDITLVQTKGRSLAHRLRTRPRNTPLNGYPLLSITIILVQFFFDDQLAVYLNIRVYLLDCIYLDDAGKSEIGPIGAILPDVAQAGSKQRDMLLRPETRLRRYMASDDPDFETEPPIWRTRKLKVK
jgi:hypothetical protein